MPAPWRRVAFVAHKALLTPDGDENSAEAVRACIDAGVSRIEVDVHSLAGPDYIVYHDRRLIAASGDSISVGRATLDDVRAFRASSGAGTTPLLLSELMALLCDTGIEVQLDLKDWRPLGNDRLRALSECVEPMKERVIVSTGQDWNLQRLHHFDPEIPYGFDPGHYIDHFVEGAPVFLPRTVGAYGYRDDHPMAFGRTETTDAYLRERFTMLSLQAPGAREYFLSWRLVLQMLDDGFDAVTFLAERGAQTNVWTLDFATGGAAADGAAADSLDALARIAGAGVSRVTTNTLLAWRDAVGEVAGGNTSEVRGRAP